MIDYIACILVRALNYIFRFIPINAPLWFGRCIGNVAFFFNKKRRLVAYANLKAAFSHEKSPSELKGITRRSYQNLVQTFVELLNLTKVNRAYVDRYVEVVNMDRIRNAAKSGRGTILLTAHFGDWELSSLVSSVEGYPILVLAREQKMKRLNELLNRLRESNGCTVIRKGISTKNILRALYEKNIVGILSDQDAGKNGMFVEFFGRPASCHSGPFEIAERTNSIILPNFIVRTKGANHKLFLEEYIDSPASSSPDDIKRNLQKFTKLLESYIRKYPDQWLWMHKRWKSTPVRTILVLDDGKAGHLNQSLAVAEHIKKARVSQGANYEDTRTIIVKVKFKSKTAKNILGICASSANWRCHGCMKCMRWLLEKETYEQLMRTYSDFVVSCGSSLSGVNVLMAKENNAKNIVVMKPGPFIGYRKFRLALVPKHDSPPVKNNIVATDLAPNLIDEDRMKRDAETLARRVHIESSGAVGVFIGGDNPEYALRSRLVSSVVDGLLAFSSASGADLIMTTSRRTSPECEKVLKDRLAHEAKCKLLIIANEKNPPEVVGGILGLSKVVVVSEESISMISEAVSSGRPVVVFRIDKKTASATKHEGSLSKLAAAGYVTVTDAADLDAALLRAWKTAGSVRGRQVADTDRIFEAVRRLI